MAEKKKNSPEKSHMVELRIRNFQREFAKINDFQDPRSHEKSIIGFFLGTFAKSRNPDALDFLKRTLRASKSDAQARFLISALLDFGGAPAVDFLIDEFSSKDSHSVTFPLKGKNPSSNYKVLIATSFLGAKSLSSVPALSRHLQESKDPSIKILCATALGLIGDEGGMDALESALKDKDGQVREHAACAIAEIGHAAAIPYFKKISLSMLEQNIEYATKNLLKIKDKKVIPVLSKLIMDDKAKWLAPETRSQLSIALGEHRDKRAIPALVELAKREKSERGQITAIYAIGEIGGREALEALRSLAGNENSGNAANAALYRMSKDNSDKLESIPHPASVEDLKRKKSLIKG